MTVEPSTRVFRIVLPPGRVENPFLKQVGRIIEMEIVTRTRGRAKNPYLKQVGSNMEMKIVTRTRPIMKIAGKN